MLDSPRPRRDGCVEEGVKGREGGGMLLEVELSRRGKGVVPEGSEPWLTLLIARERAPEESAPPSRVVV